MADLHVIQLSMMLILWIICACMFQYPLVVDDNDVCYVCLSYYMSKRFSMAIIDDDIYLF